MKKKIMGALCALALLFGFAAPVAAQGSLPVALQQISDQNGRPIVGALLYFYQVGTVATRQDSFQDTGLTISNQWPLPTDAYGRVPMFYVASGSIHVRLTDASGLVIFDYPNMLVIGPSGGGGGGGSTVDPTTIASTGDTKFRPTSESLTGWVKMNGLTIGSAASGATGRANADTQALFIYEWTNCPNAHCPVSTGRGASGLADFNANKTLQVPDCRARICGVGLDDMGAAASGRLQALNVTSGGGDGVTTPNATGGENVHTLTQAQLPAVAPTFTGTPQTPSLNQSVIGPGGNSLAAGGFIGTTITPTVTFTPAGTISNLGSGVAMNVMTSFMLGTWFLKL